MAELETYYNFHKSLLSVLGLWPHNRSKFLVIQKTAFSLIPVSFIVPQCLVLTVSDVTPNLVLKILSPITMCVGAFVKYTVFWYQSDAIEWFLDKVEYDWKMNRDEGLQILKQHASLGKYYGKFFASFIYSSAVGLVLLDVSNYIVRVITHKNDTFNFPVPLEYLVDERTYYLPIVVHRCVSTLVVATTFVATESMFIMLLQHCGSLFNVTSRHIVKAVTQDTTNLGGGKKPLINDSKASLITAIVLHRRAIKTRQLGEDLCFPTLGTRLASSQIIRHLSTKLAIQSMINSQVEINEIPSTSTQEHDDNGKKTVVGSCYMCQTNPEKKRRNTRKACHKCHRPICDEHANTIAICRNCPQKS